MEEQFEGNMNFQDGKYTVNLPFREENPTLPNNYNIAANRLKTLTKCLRRDPDTMKEYDRIIAEQLDKGIIERVDMNKPMDEGKAFYSPIDPL